MHWASVTAVGKDGGCPHREPQWPSLPGAGRLDLASHLALCSPSPTLSAGEEVELPGSGWVSGSSPRGGGAIPRSPSQDLMHRVSSCSLDCLRIPPQGDAPPQHRSERGLEFCGGNPWPLNTPAKEERPSPSHMFLGDVVQAPGME